MNKKKQRTKHSIKSDYIWIKILGDFFFLLSYIVKFSTISITFIIGKDNSMQGRGKRKRL